MSNKDNNNTDPLLDFRNFLWLVWKHLSLPDPTPIQYDLATYLQRGPRRLVIEAFRGVGKSWITSAYVCWLLYCDPQHNVLVVSASKQRADDFTTFTLRLINEIEELKHLRPGPGQRNSKIAFDVGPSRADHAPSVKSIGITGQLAGSRADTIVADDIEIPSNSATETMREALREMVKEFDAIIRKNGRIIYLGTPQTEQSLYNILAERGYVIRVWPAHYPKEKVRIKYGGRLAPMIANALDENPDLVDEPTDPDRFNEQDLLERRLSYGSAGYALQFMLDTSLSDAEKFPLRVSDLIVVDLNPRKGPTEIMWASSPDLVENEVPNVAMAGDRFYRPMHIEKEFVEYTGSIMAIDPSGRGTDETSYAVVKMLHGRLYVTAAGGFKGGYEDDVLKKLLKIAKDQEVNKIIVEPNFGDGMFKQLLKAKSQEVYAVAIDDSAWSTQRKEERIIDTLEPVMNQHRLVVSKDIVQSDFDSTIDYPKEDQNNYRLFYQMTRITRDKGALKKDDRLDALAIAVGYWLDHMSRNTAQANQDWQDKQLRKEIKDFKRGVHTSLTGRQKAKRDRKRSMMGSNRAFS